MRGKNIAHLGLAVLTLLCSCAKNGSQITSANQTSFSTVDETTPAFVYQLFQLDNTTHETAYLGSLQKTATGFEWPSQLSSYLTGFDNGASAVRYIIKAYSLTSTGSNGDFYYEVPVVSRNVVLNGPSTALWLALKNSLANSAIGGSAAPLPTLLSMNTWQNALYLINTQCSDCLQRPGGYTSQLLSSNSALRNAINLFFSTTGSGQLDAQQLSSPPLEIALSTPPVFVNMQPMGANQGDTENVQIVWADPLDLSKPVYPDAWQVSIAGNPSYFSGNSSDASQASWTFDFTHTGAEQITALKTIRNMDISASFNFTVNAGLESPVFPSLTVAFQANHLGLYNIAGNATDPRNETLTYQLISNPSGMTLSGSTLRWNPTQVPSQLGANAVIVLITNSDQQSVVGTINAQVSADNYPTFANNPATTWSLNEGSTGTYIFDAADADGDPIEVTCVTGCSSLVSGSPAGAGWPASLSYPNGSIYSSSNNIEQISLSYMPSYLQTLGVDQVDNIVLRLNYPLTSQTLRQVATPAQMQLGLHIHNVADPPVWMTQPGPSPSPLPTEMIAMTSFPGGVSQDPAYNPGNNVPLIYTIDQLAGSPGSAANCSWLIMNPSTAQLSGTPPYSSSGTCSFQVRATDSLGLFSDSTAFTVAVVDVPRPLGSPLAVPNQTATERTQFQLNLASYINDPDMTAGDPRENLSFTCANCSALGIPTSSQANTSNQAYFNGSTFTWTPGYAIAPTGGTKVFSGVNILVTKNEYPTSPGNTANIIFNLTVNDAPTNLALSFTSGTISVNSGTSPVSASVNAGDPSGTVTLQVANLPSDASTYPYSIALSCSPGCSIASPLSISGSGAPASYPITIQTSETDGYGGSSASYNALQISAVLTPNSYPNLTTSTVLTVKVGTVDGPLTALGINSDVGGGAYHLPTIDGTQFSNNTAALSAQGPDSSNDSFIYTFQNQASAFGTISGSLWTFNPITANCVQQGATPFTATFGILATSSHGQSITRNVSVTVTNSKIPNSSGNCP